MAEKRRDSKNRVLRTGESQRADGRYAYKYKDVYGNTKFVYSWKLEPTDRIPKGKRDCKSLRDMEKEIQKDLADGIVSTDMTVLELFGAYLGQKSGLAPTTQQNYANIQSVLSMYRFGARKVTDVKISDAKAFALELYTDGRKYRTVRSYIVVLYGAFQMACLDDLIRKNPFSFRLSSVIKPDMENRQALTAEQEADFLQFVRESSAYNGYYDAVFLLLNTGLRISELCGLTMDSIDLDNKVIHVTQQLIFDNISRCARIIPPKSKNSIRELPIMPDVLSVIQHIIAKRPDYVKEPEVDGVSGFLFLSDRGVPMLSGTWGSRFRRMSSSYAKTFPDFADAPSITPHVLRHTFCSKLIRAGVNPKSVQYLMGHRNLRTTLDIYTHLGLDDIRTELNSVWAKSIADRRPGRPSIQPKCSNVNSVPESWETDTKAGDDIE